MERNVHHRNVDDLLSQSCVEIHTIAAKKNALYNDFQVPENILEERKKAWNDLFEKYSAMVPGIELNVHTLQPEGEVNLSEVIEPRLPMRKSMSMVQYWVETGNLAHKNWTSNPIGLVLESSTVENNNLELTENVDSLSLTTSTSTEKHSNFGQSSGNKNTRVFAESNSSIDTAAYILANNYVTKKVETIAIVKGSKVSPEIPTTTNNFPEIFEMTESKNHIGLAKKNNSNKLSMRNIDLSQSILFTSYVDKITENIKNANLDKKCSGRMISMSEQQENRICSIFLSDSDESQNLNLQNHRNSSNYTSNNLSRAIKRKKLYKRSDSPAEFTPVSEDNLSLKSSRMMTGKCLPLRSSEHPALETPKVRSRFLACTRFGMKKSNRKLDQIQGFSPARDINNPISMNDKILDPSKINYSIQPTLNKNRTTVSNTTANRKLDQIQGFSPTRDITKPISMNDRILDPSKINYSIQRTLNKNRTTISNTSANQTISKGEHIQKNNSHDSMNVMRQSCLNQPNEINKAFVRVANIISNCDDFLEPKSELKSCQVVLERLPHNYYLSSSIKQVAENNKPFNIMKYGCTQNFIKNPPDFSLKSNIALSNNLNSFAYSAKNLTENTTDTRTQHFKTFGDIHIVQDKCGYKGNHTKCPDKRKSVYAFDKFKIPDKKDSASNIYPIKEILTKHLKMTNKENLNKVKTKYVIVDSSSDESDLIVPLSINKNQLVSKSKNPKKISSKNLSHQLFKSKSEIPGPFTTVENDTKFKTSTYKHSGKTCSNEDKMRPKNVFEDYKIDNDMQYNKVIENVYVDKCKCNILPCDYKKHKYKVRNMSIISSSKKEKKKSVLTRKQLKTVNSAIMCKQLSKFTHATVSKYKNTSYNMTNDHVSLQEFHQMNDEAINKKSSKLISACDKLNVYDSRSNKKKQTSHTSLSDNNPETLLEIMLINPVNDDKLPSTCTTVSEDSLKVEKNELSLTKPTQLKALVQIVSMVTQKISTKKRSSYEIDLSSDEECIIPLKKYEKKI